MFEFLTGRHPLRVTSGLLIDLGSIAARMHHLTADRPSRIARPHSRKNLSKLRAAARGKSRTIEGWERFRNLVKAYLAEHDWLFDLFHRLPSGDIHHDLRPANLLVDRQYRICGVLDFGECQFGPFALELARMWHYMCLDGRTRRVDPTKVERLNSGYELERRLRRPEFEALTHLFQLANLVDADLQLTAPGQLPIARGTATALPATAISCLGAFRTPDAGARGESAMPASENQHNNQHN